MNRLNNWFFRGWVRVPIEGTKRFSMEYVGEKYGYSLDPAPYKAFKRRRVLVFAADAALYLAGALAVAKGAMWRLVALPQILTLVALIWLGMGVGRTALSPERFSYRDYRAGAVRTMRSAWAAAVLTALTLAAEIGFLILFAGQYRLWRELIFVGELVLGIGLNGWFILDVKKTPCVIVEGPKEN